MNAEKLLDRKVAQFRKEGWPDHRIRGYVRKWREVRFKNPITENTHE